MRLRSPRASRHVAAALWPRRIVRGALAGDAAAVPAGFETVAAALWPRRGSSVGPSRRRRGPARAVRGIRLRRNARPARPRPPRPRRTPPPRPTPPRRPRGVTATNPALARRRRGATSEKVSLVSFCSSRGRRDAPRRVVGERMGSLQSHRRARRRKLTRARTLRSTIRCLQATVRTRTRRAESARRRAREI